MAFNTPNTQLFLNKFEDEEVSEFKAELYTSGPYSNLVNHRHMETPFTMAQMETMERITPQNHKFLKEWMECYIQEQHLQKPPVQHHNVILRVSGSC
jgi:hypothetical protein